MENDENEMSVEGSIFRKNNNTFSPDYFGQNVKNSTSFKKWKNSMLQIYGNNAVLIYCPEDDLYFYSSDKEKTKSLYCFQCPKCKKNFCYYCSSVLSKVDIERHRYGRCSIKGRIIFSFRESYEDEIVSIYYIPFMNSLWIILRISQFLFYTLDNKNGGYYRHF